MKTRKRVSRFNNVRDDGVGFDAATAREHAEQGGGLGLLGMEERVRPASGRYYCRSAPGQGTEIRAIFALTNSDDRAG
jgi:signal transduction histidine kinase